jgi:C-lobe and N-lobe beta barrels of Tf-binding protein B
MVGNTLRLNLPADQTTASFSQDTFFYQKPGTTTKYVTFAGFLRNNLTAVRVDTAAVDATPTTPAVAATSKTTYSNKLARGAAVFGELTLNSNVPKSGSGTYTGAMLATAVINDQLDNNASAPSYFQWIEGSSTTNVNFGANTFSLVLNGNVLAPQLDGVSSGGHTIRTGAKFNAEGKGNIDLVSAGGFLGQFQRVWFVNPDNSRIDLLIAGSSIDGAFYGPAAQEVGGSYRIVGGTPDQRIDILGIFTGKQ